jgi:hypothetical protein
MAGPAGVDETPVMGSPRHVVPWGSVLPLALACTARVPTIDDAGDGGSTGSATTAESFTTTSGDPDPSTGMWPDVETEGVDPPTEGIRKADILFVVDNSNSMAAYQATLARGVEALVEELESDALRIDWRIGIATTDNSATRWCSDGPDVPEHLQPGVLRATSCRSRSDEFVVGVGTASIDERDAACLDACPLDDLGLQPSPVEGDLLGNAVRPWIQGGPDTNVPADASIGDVLACAIPQGIRGCGFEVPLTAVWQAIDRAIHERDGDRAHGFVRSDAHLFVVIVTDEADCSTRPGPFSILEPTGDRAYWDEDWTAPTSAVCWRAAVECTGGPGTYDECHSVERDLLGAPTSDPEAQAMYPVDHVREILDEVAGQKDPGAGVFVTGILGVPAGGAPIPYADVPDDSQFQESFGIGPGCTGPRGSAVPPVRIRELSETYPLGAPLGSICADDYADALRPITSLFRP